MKKTLFPFIGALAATLFSCQTGYGQISRLPQEKAFIPDSIAATIKKLPPLPAPDAGLARKGFKAYRMDNLSKISQLKTGQLAEFSLEEFKEKEKNGGKIPLHTPLFFQENMGQADSRFKYILQNAGSAVGFHNKGFIAIVQKGIQGNEIKNDTASLKGNLIALNFVDAAGSIEAKKKIEGRISHYKGPDKNKWLTNIPAFAVLANDNLYPGIRLAYQARTGRIEYQLLVKASARISDIKIAVAGTEKLSIDKKGNLIMHTSGGPVAQTAPRFYAITGNKRIQVRGAFRLISDTEYGFTATNPNRNTDLLIDPEIIFTTYYGGSGRDGMLLADDGANDFIGQGFDVKTGADGTVFIVGKTFSADFPVSDATVRNGSGDAFVMRINPYLPAGANLLYATFLGGSGDENARSIEAMADGSAYITGWSASSDFPTSPGVVQPTRLSSGAFVAKLSPDGEFQLGTFIGKARSNHPNSIVYSKNATDSEGFIYVGGSAASSAFQASDATAGSFQQTHKGGSYDGFITKIDLNLSRYEYFTYLGGSGRDVIMDIDVVDGFAFATGMTASKDFPTNDISYQQQHTEQDNAACTGTLTGRECAEAFVTRLNRTGDAIIYSTYIGETGKEDYARGIAVNARKQAFITGASASAENNSSHIFVAKLEAGGENILWKTSIEGIERDHGEELVVDQFDRVYVTGTISVDGHATGAGATFRGGTSDIFYCRITEDGEPDYFSYLGGEGEDRGFAIAAVSASRDEFCVTVVGATVSDDIETISPLSGGDARRGNADLLIYTLCNVSFNIEPSAFFKDGPSSIRRGDIITYTITFINPGDAPIPVNIADNVPSAINVTSVSGPGCSRAANSISCAFQAQPGATTIVITGRVNNAANPANCEAINITNAAILRAGGRRLTATATTRVLCQCGNDRKDPGEECDGTPGCRSNCTLRRCGDGILDPGEKCENGYGNRQCSSCQLCKIVLKPDCGCGSGITGKCPSGTSCRHTVSVVRTCVLDLFGLCIGADTVVMLGGPYCLRN
ncbi:MAG: hypothetical protein P0Y53_14430 [Candidatus Pseudobacter hemicellulosilyticus]|uniref:DUF7948 domain-containing protein n=1 Tax=Candidatus Pseudobacter hemicellulosilyticus TaxID=3121375 RepID=A0AAJ5WKS4_9BACT|nr:MAG: hypothetical protein P0Y53_14430 [Pseudobacter sp.]